MAEADAEHRPRVGLTWFDSVGLTWTDLDWVGLGWTAEFTIYEPNVGLAIRFTSVSVRDGTTRGFRFDDVDGYGRWHLIWHDPPLLGSRHGEREMAADASPPLRCGGRLSGSILGSTFTAIVYKSDIICQTKITLKL